MAEEDTWGDEDWWDDGTSWAATAWEESSEWPEEPDGEVSLAEDSTPLGLEAMTADWTWSQAHKSTQMLRKDRLALVRLQRRPMAASSVATKATWPVNALTATPKVEKERGKADRSISLTRSTRTTMFNKAARRAVAR